MFRGEVSANETASVAVGSVENQIVYCSRKKLADYAKRIQFDYQINVPCMKPSRSPAAIQLDPMALSRPATPIFAQSFLKFNNFMNINRVRECVNDGPPRIYQLEH